MNLESYKKSNGVSTQMSKFTNFQHSASQLATAENRFNLLDQTENDFYNYDFFFNVIIPENNSPTPQKIVFMNEFIAFHSRFKVAQNVLSHLTSLFVSILNIRNPNEDVITLLCFDALFLLFEKAKNNCFFLLNNHILEALYKYLAYPSKNDLLSALKVVKCLTNNIDICERIFQNHFQIILFNKILENFIGNREIDKTIYYILVNYLGIIKLLLKKNKNELSVQNNLKKNLEEIYYSTYIVFSRAPNFNNSHICSINFYLVLFLEAIKKTKVIPDLKNIIEILVEKNNITNVNFCSDNIQSSNNVSNRSALNTINENILNSMIEDMNKHDNLETFEQSKNINEECDLSGVNNSVFSIDHNNIRYVKVNISIIDFFNYVLKSTKICLTACHVLTIFKKIVKIVFGYLQMIDLNYLSILLEKVNQATVQLKTIEFFNFVIQAMAGESVHIQIVNDVKVKFQQLYIFCRICSIIQNNGFYMAKLIAIQTFNCYIGFVSQVELARNVSEELIFSIISTINEKLDKSTIISIIQIFNKLLVLESDFVGNNDDKSSLFYDFRLDMFLFSNISDEILSVFFESNDVSIKHELILFEEKFKCFIDSLNGEPT